MDSISGITYYYLEDDTIECIITDDNIHIKNSYLITSDDKKLEIIDDLLESFPWFKDHRTNKDMLSEWRVHNWFYRLNIKKNNTKDTDLEYKQNFFLKLLYAIFSKLAKKNV